MLAAAARVADLRARLCESDRVVAAIETACSCPPDDPTCAVIAHRQQGAATSPASAVRGRIGWKYCLGLELTGKGFGCLVLLQRLYREDGPDGHAEVTWYKAHYSETVPAPGDPEAGLPARPSLVTCAETTHAAVPDGTMPP